MIPLFDTKPTNTDLMALDRAARSTSYIGGEEVRLLEEEICDYLGVKNCVTVANGTDALTLMLRAAKPPWTFLTTTPYTFGATVEAVVDAGHVPCFLDIGEDYNVPPCDLGVHLFGNVTFGYIYEDACQAFGASDGGGRKAGTIGKAAAFSFFPTKPLSCMGDGGCVTTDDDALAHEVRLLANHGMKSKFLHQVIGVNSRLDAIQAAVLRVRLKRIDRDNEHRREAAAYYDENLQGLVGTPVTSGKPAYHLYVCIHDRAADLVPALRVNGIGTGIYYPEPLHTQPAFKRYATSPLPVVESVAGKTFALPCHQNITRKEQDSVIKVVREVLS